MTYGRAISDDGARVVWAVETATNSSQVFLYDGRNSLTRQITSLGVRVSDVAPQATISGDGSRIAFATRRTVVSPASDGGVDLYTYDIPSSTFARVTNAPSSATAEVVSSLNDDGSVIAFNFPRVLTGVSNDDFANNSEIYVADTPSRPASGTVTVLNGASFGHEPSSPKAVAPGSIAVAVGRTLAITAEQTHQLSDGTFPLSVGGTTVTVNGRRAQILYVSPTQVNFLVPTATEIGTAEVIVTNPDGFPSPGAVSTLRAAPGIFTFKGDGAGDAVILSADSLQSGPFDPSGGNLRLIIFSTGIRNGAQVSAMAGGHTLKIESIEASPNLSGLDEVHVMVPADLRGAGTVDLVFQADARDSNSVAVTYVGEGRRDIVINEFLADPPDGITGDANHDSVRSASDDEFIELVNTTIQDIDIGGYQILTRGGNGTSDAVRHTFPAGTILHACSAIVVFGGGGAAFNPHNAVFGGAQVLKASSSGGLNLINSSGAITLRDQNSGIVNLVSYGGSTGLAADANQSLTRSPDSTGGFTLHQPASEGARLFSPGTRVNGAAFSICSPVARVEVLPSLAAIELGAHQQFTARAIDAFGNEVAGVIFSWQSSDTSVATIDQNGLATGISAGSTEIRAAGRGVQSAPAMLTVHPPPPVLTSITISPTSATIGVGETLRLTAQAKDQLGQDIGGVMITFASDNTTVATVDSGSASSRTGSAPATVKAHASGSVGISATAKSDNTIITSRVAAITVEPRSGQMLISEFRTRGPNGSADEFVEIYNPTTSTINIGGLKIRASNNTGNVSDRAAITVGTTLGSGCHYLVANNTSTTGYSGSVPANQTYKTGITDDGGIAVTGTDGTTIIDSVGTSSGSAYKEGGPLKPLTANANQSYERQPGGAGGNGTDTNNNTSDFMLTPSSNPQNLSSACLNLNSADLALSETDEPDPVITGSDVTYTINVTNNGAGTAQSVEVSDNLPRTVTFVSCSSTGSGVCGGTGKNRTITFASLPSGASASITLVATANGADGTTIANTATVTSATSDPNPNNNAATTTTDVRGPRPALSINDVSLNEGNNGTTTFSFGVTLSVPAPTGGVTFDIATADGTAIAANGDYVARSLIEQTIPAGQQSYIFDVTVNGDTLVEPNETVFVNVTNVSGASVTDGEGLGTSQNDDNPNLVISQVYAGGGNSGAHYANDFVEIFNRGTTIINFAVTPYSIQYAGVTAFFGSNKVDLTAGITFPGQYFLVQLSSGGANGVALPHPDAIGSISMAATAGKVTLVVGPTALSALTCPGDDGTPPFNPNIPAIADFVGYGSTANCYEGSAGPATAPGNSTADFRKTGGCTDTSDNSADFLASAPFPRNTGSSANNCVAGSPPNLAINDMTVIESNSGTVTATFTVALSAPALATDVTFDIATQNNSATTSNSDYVARTLTNQVIPAGQRSYTFGVTVNGDTTVEPNETFFVNVINVIGATIADGQGLGTIQNDDFPTLTINDVSLNEGNHEATTFTFTANLSAPASSGGVTFDIATQDNTATVAGNDYIAKSLMAQTIPEGSQAYAFDVVVNGDVNIEPNETFFVNVTNVSGATVMISQGVGTIQNDDNPPTPALTINDVSMNEGHTGSTTFTFTVALSIAAPAGGITFDIATADGTAHDHNPATEDSDYIPLNLTLQTIPEGGQTYSFHVTVNGDTLVEPNETFFVNVTNVSGASVSDSHGQGTIQNDDIPLLVISQIYGGGGNTGASYQNDFVEIFNRGTTTVDFSVTPYSMQYAAATSAFGTNKTDLTSGVIAPGRYFLIKEALGGGVGSAVPTPDATGTINLAATAGKVALVVGTTTLNGVTCPGDDGVSPFNPNVETIADFLGYGSSANCYEGSGPRAVSVTNSNARSIIRTASCIDTNNNSADFSNPTSAVTARSSVNASALCP
ncbi:MAG: lamin tail domain-containing protein [Acidobacteriota bacterium]|nr:lamin tail domain-containing protein [Acidobacteriota bacterium]